MSFKIIFCVLSAVILTGTSLAAEDSKLKTAWADIGKDNAIHIVSRQQARSGKTSKKDDSVVIDFMDYQSNNKLITTAGSSDKEVKLTGTLKIGRGRQECDFNAAIQVQSPDRITYSVAAESSQPINKPYFSLRFNKNMMNRPLTLRIRPGSNRLYFKKVVVAADHKGGWIWSSPSGQDVEGILLPMLHGNLKLSGFKCPVMICKYGKNTGNIRIYLDKGKVKSIKGSLSISFEPYKTVFLDLSKAANIAFADEKGGDRKGGWTDQGSIRDMSKMLLGKRKYGNIEFNVIDPAKNHGKAALAFANNARPYFLKEATINAGSKRFDYLYLLHAGAWCNSGNVGSIKVNYADGSSSSFTVKARRDVADWWNPDESFKNATPIWKTQYGNNFGGLYLSRFKVKRKPVKSITFRTANNAVWLISAVSGVTGEPPLIKYSTQEVPFKAAEGKEWKVFRFDKNIVKGSALDFSGTLDAPAGKYGALIIKGDQFYFSKRPDRPVKFMGLNICGDYNYLEHSDSDKLVEWIATRGYNTIRLHHFDEALVKPGSTSPEFDPERLDRLFYFISRAKAKGIYITLDLYTRRITGFKRKYKNMFDLKTRALFDKSIRDNILQFGRKLLTTVNPYTKLALKDDPALTIVGIINEDPLFTHHTQYKYPKAGTERNALIKPVFEDWCKRKGLNPKKINNEMWVHFVIDRHIEIYKEMKSYLRKIGVKAPLSDISCGITYPSAVARNQFDYVDNHFYFDHPKFVGKSFRMPMYFKNQNGVKELFPHMMGIAGTRIFGKPFTVTEFNFCVPNMYRGEGGPAIGSVAALQGWNGIFRFSASYSHKYRKYGVLPLMNGGHLGTFSVINDPIQGLSERITMLFYLRGDVAEAKSSTTLTIPADVWKLPEAAGYRNWFTREQSNTPKVFNDLGLYHKIGLKISSQNGSGNFNIKNLIKTKKINVRAKAPGVFDMKQGLIVSSTGQITTDSTSGDMKVITPKSEALVITGKALVGKCLKVTGNNTFSTFFAGALDNKPLSKSKHILVLHLTDVKATGQKLAFFRDNLRMYNYGKFRPYLVRRGKANISLLTDASSCEVNALDINGKVLKNIPVKIVDGRISFKAATDCGPKDKAVLAYELIRK